jgi:hypothetical protein
MAHGVAQLSARLGGDACPNARDYAAVGGGFMAMGPRMDKDTQVGHT